MRAGVVSFARCLPGLAAKGRTTVPPKNPSRDRTEKKKHEFRFLGLFLSSFMKIVCDVRLKY